MSKLGEEKFNVSQTTEIVCEKCGGTVFTQGVMLRKIPAVMTGQGKEGILPVPTFYCVNCGHTNTEFIPEEFRGKNIEKISI